MEGTSRGLGRDAMERGKRRRSSEEGDTSVTKKHAGVDQPDGSRPSARGGAAGAARKNIRIQEILHTRPHDRPKQGQRGEKLELKANYFRLTRNAEWSLFKYHITFEPEVLMARVRSALIFHHKKTFGGYLFDGTQLFLTRQLEADQLELVSENREGVEHRIKLRFTKEILMTDNESIQVLNLILRRAMQGLQLKLVQRNYYDPLKAENLQQFNIQLWPGYDTSIRQHEYDILVNADVSNKVMRTDTVYDLMKQTLRGNNFQSEFQQKVLGITVLTDYNNATYRIDDVDFDKSPSSTFTKAGREVSFIEYYQQKYNKTIRDPNQPLLVSKAKEKSIRGGSSELILLIPELCRMTGLSEQQRTDINLKNAMRPFTAMNPVTRINRLLEFNRRLYGQKDSMDTLNEWKLNLERDLVKVTGRQIAAQKLNLGDNQNFIVQRANWDRECGKPLYQSKDLRRWYIVYSKRLEQESRNLWLRLQHLVKNMQFHVTEPRRLVFQNDNEMIRHLDSAVKENPQMILCVIDNNRGDSYSQIKKKLCHDYAIPSQVVTRKTVTRRNNFDSVVTKIAIQMCTKLGGAPWLPVIPVKGIMTIGYDVSVDTVNKRQSFGALVATMDLKQGVNFFSAVSSHSDSEQLSTDFAINVVKALHAYRKEHNTLPEKIIIYRGGVGDGQIGYVRDVEVSHLETKMKEIYSQMNLQLELLFIIVNKRINTRIFLGNANPPAGTIVDDVITLPERYDFYLVPQNTTQGTASPTLYNVIHDTTTGLPPGRVQMWTYKMCHIYYNWSGTVRVPAVMQYATKLSFLLANSIHRLPNNDLENKLYFL